MLLPDAQPGDYLVTATGGWFGRWIRRICNSPVNHAAVYLGNGIIVEAVPNGAGRGLVSEYPHAVWSTIPLSLPQRHEIVRQARALVGTPYNFLDIAAQFLVRVFKWHAPQFAIDRVSRPDRLQCAQLVDLAYQRAGVTLFPDGRPNGLVAPSDLYDLIEQKDADG